MLSEALPCFQLLRMGPASPGDSPNQDLYTFRPASPNCTYKLGRRAEVCDITLVSERDPGLVSRVHAELHAERDPESTAGEWRVSLADCSAHGTYINAIRAPRGQHMPLNDGDLLTFGHPHPVPVGCPLPAPHPSGSEFCFLFQKVRVRPQDFAAITEPKAPWAFPGGFRPVQASGNHRIRSFSRPSAPPGRSKATLILSSVGSLSKLKPLPLTFPLGRTLHQPPPVPEAPARSSRNRRKSAHTLLPELEDEQEVMEERRHLQEETGPKLQITKRRGRPRKMPLGGTCLGFSPSLSSPDLCAAPRCRLPQDDTVEWVQCDGCDAWFHVACVGCSYRAVQEADFRCGHCRL
uniref:Transcription factor 19 n=1 Tax=Sphenodon punctatus TaxID=8508 RepID=A0A8D0GX65_SPHPU